MSLSVIPEGGSYSDYACFGPQLADGEREEGKREIEIYLFALEQDNGFLDTNQDRTLASKRLTSEGDGSSEYGVRLEHLPKPR